MRSEGGRVADLVSANAAALGFRFPASVLQAAMRNALRRTRFYTADPFGRPEAREAVAHYYRSEGLSVPADQIVLTPGTSMSYFYLFKALADPGDSILCPTPGYPLFDMIARLADVTVDTYPLHPQTTRWAIDLKALEAAVTPKTKALILISPHNPTGAVATDLEVAGLVDIARKHRMAIISDEVFSPFLLTGSTLPRPATHREAPLVITLNGFSKMFALPGLKIGWMAITGETDEIRKLKRILEMLSDAFLPVQDTAQAAMPAVFNSGAHFLQHFRRGVRLRATHTVSLLQRATLTSGFVPPEGGFYAVIPLPSKVDDEAFALNLLRQHKVFVHPGYLYNLSHPAIVISLINPGKDIAKLVKVGFRSG